MDYISLTFLFILMIIKNMIFGPRWNPIFSRGMYPPLPTPLSPTLKWRQTSPQPLQMPPLLCWKLSVLYMISQRVIWSIWRILPRFYWTQKSELCLNSEVWTQKSEAFEVSSYPTKLKSLTSCQPLIYENRKLHKVTFNCVVKLPCWSTFYDNRTCYLNTSFTTNKAYTRHFNYWYRKGRVISPNFHPQ